MNTPFDIDKEGKLRLRPDVLSLIPELRDLSDRELNAVIYAIDYHCSPARLKPLDERKAEAFKKFYRKEKLKGTDLERFNRAAESYHSLIFDIRREKIDSYKKKILAMDREVLNEDISFNRIKDIDQAGKYLLKQIDDLEKEYDSDKEYIRMRKDKNLSFVEQWQMNIKRYGEFRGMMEVTNL